MIAIAKTSRLVVIASACWLGACAAELGPTADDGAPRDELVDTVITLHADGSDTVETFSVDAADAADGDGVASEALVRTSPCDTAELVLYDEPYEAGRRLCFRDDGSGAPPAWFSLASVCRMFTLQCYPGPMGRPVCSTTCAATWAGAVRSYRAGRAGYLDVSTFTSPTRFVAGTVSPNSYAGFDRVTFTDAAPIEIHRSYRSGSGDQFYTNDAAEAAYARAALGYESLGVSFRAWSAPFPGTIPMHRAWDPSRGVHLYTTRDGDLAGTWYEGVLAWVHPPTDEIPFSCRLYEVYDGTGAREVHTTSMDDVRFTQACGGYPSGGRWEANVSTASLYGSCATPPSAAVATFASTGRCPNGSVPTPHLYTWSTNQFARADRPQTSRWHYYDRLDLPASMDLDELRVSASYGIDEVVALRGDMPCDSWLTESNAVFFGNDERLTRDEIRAAFGSTRGGELRVRLCVRSDTSYGGSMVSVSGYGRAW